MSDVIPYYGGRSGRDEFEYGRKYYGSLDESLDDGSPLPPIDFSNVAYDRWTIRMSHMARGIREEYWNVDLKLRESQRESSMNGDRIFYTLLYRMMLSISVHDKFDQLIYYIYHGYLNGILEEEEDGLLMEVTPPLLHGISVLGGWYIRCPFYEYDTIALDEDGYYYSNGEDSEREIEE